MKFTVITSLVLQALLLRTAEASACKRKDCNADNCARAATGTFDGNQALRTSACSSFQQCTVVPATATFTSVVSVTPAPVTQLITVTTLTSVQVIPTTVTAAGAIGKKRSEQYGGIIIGDVEKRAVTSLAAATTICPTAVPASASACSGSTRYASACSCAGITKSYTTVAAPSTTITVTSVVPQPTETVPVVASAVVTSYDVSTVTPLSPFPTSFQVQINFPSGSDANSAQYQSLFLAPDNGIGELSARPQASGIFFELDSASELVNAGSTGAGTDRVAVGVDPGQGTVIVWDTRQHYQASHVSYPFTKCTPALSTLVPGFYTIQCRANRGVRFAICDANQWNSVGGAGTRSDAFVMLFAADQSHAGCYLFEPLVVNNS